MKNILSINTFCGGICQTNGYLIDCPEGTIAIDAPEGMMQWLQDQEATTKALLLTHLHFDHVIDAAAIASTFQCPVFAHSALTPELHLGEMFAQLTGMPIEVAEFELQKTLEGESSLSVAGVDFQLIHVPGHSPDSLCFYLPDQGVLFAGDTLFESSIGRSDFPGGDQDLLITGIRDKLLTLPENTQVFAGHCEQTTISNEIANNPYFSS